ncbi:hypothetical protein [uncultured Mediterranean phage]|nr:hypothetical protein [uncultured Mediterranean phage]
MAKALTLQQLFNRVGKHLLTQLQQSTNPHEDQPGKTVCLYRNRSGLQCAIGCLIPDTHYHPGMEDRPVRSLLDDPAGPTLDAARLAHNIQDLSRLLSSLQTAHDGALANRRPSYYRKVWSGDLATIARRQNLSTRWIKPLMHKE